MRPEELTERDFEALATAAVKARAWLSGTPPTAAVDRARAALDVALMPLHRSPRSIYVDSALAALRADDDTTPPTVREALGILGASIRYALRWR